MKARVKTLHPRVHMSLLGRVDNSGDQKILKENKLELFDLVIGNLYPFADALKKGLEFDELIEYVDVGGPSFLRAAAKNFKSIAVVCDPSDYQWILSKSTLSDVDRKVLAAK